MSQSSAPRPEERAPKQTDDPDKRDRRKNWFFRGMGALLGGVLATVLLTDAPTPWGKTTDDTPAETRPHKQPQESDNGSTESWPRYAPETYTPQHPQQQPTQAPSGTSNPAGVTDFAEVPGRVLWETRDGHDEADNTQDVTNAWRVVDNQYTDIVLKKSEIPNSSKARSEKMLTPVPQNKTYNFQYSFQLAPDHQNGADEEFIVGQLHGTVPVSPPLALLIKGDTMYLDYRRGPGAKPELKELGPVEKGQWYHIQMEVNASQSSEGYAKILVNGQERGRVDGPVGYGEDPYFKIGVYWWQYANAPSDQKHVLIKNVRLVEMLTAPNGN